jgi:hypothetical protein
VYVYEDDGGGNENDELLSVLMVEDVAATAAFYKAHFLFEGLFESDWYAFALERG